MAEIPGFNRAQTLQFDTSPYTFDPPASGGRITAGGAAGMIGVAMQGVSSFMQGQAQTTAYATSADEAYENMLATKRRGRYEQWLMSAEIQRQIGRQKAQFAQAGVKLKGTARDILKESLTNMRRDKAVARSNYKQIAEGHRQRYKALKSAESKSGFGAVIGGVGGGVAAGSFFGPVGMIAGGAIGLAGSQIK